MRTHLLIAATSCGLLALGGAVNAQSITNGTFDTFVPSNGTGGGWTTSNVDGGGGHRTTGGNPGSFFILNDAGQAGTDPTISQTITGLTPGLTYTITGDYRAVFATANTGATQAFGVFTDGTVRFQSPGVQDFNWRYSVLTSRPSPRPLSSRSPRSAMARITISAWIISRSTRHRRRGRNRVPSR